MERERQVHWRTGQEGKEKKEGGWQSGQIWDGKVDREWTCERKIEEGHTVKVKEREAVRIDVRGWGNRQVGRGRACERKNGRTGGVKQGGSQNGYKGERWEGG